MKNFKILMGVLIIQFCAHCTQNKQVANLMVPITSSSGRIVNGMEFFPMQLPNKLEVLIVSDPRFKQSSGAMAVGVGSLEDPLEYQGMAHYLEHMLFLGTKEFPKHDEYSTYMEKNGGMDNAYTSDEVTNYFFEVDNAALEGALHRFSRFFVSPLFDATYVDREKNAVNSEFEKNIKNDSWRLDRFVSQLASKDHPFSKFSTGNKDTLKNVTREQVVEFYKKYYSSNNMRLVVMTSQPSSQVKKWVAQYFSDVENSQLPELKYKDQFFDPNKKEKYHYVKSISDVDELTIVYNIPEDKKYWASKPLSIISKVLGDESQNSLLSYLKKKGWALSLSAGQNFWRTMAINITLTPDGRKNHQKVTATVFEFIRLMKEKGYPEYLYNDEKFLQKITLDNLEPSSSGQRAAFFAKALLDYPVDSFLEKYFLLSKYSVDDFNYFLSFFNPESAQVIVSSQKEQVKEKEAIFGIQYRSEKMPQATMTFPVGDAQFFKYPEKNEYIPDDFTLVGKNLYGKPLRQVDDNAEINILQDTEIGVAKSFIDVTFVSHVPVNPKNAILHELFTACKTEELKAWGYPISEARYDYQIRTNFADSMTVMVSGYSQHLFKVLNSLVLDEKNDRKLSSCKIDEKLFNEIKDRIKKDLLNHELAAASSAVSYAAQTVSYNKIFHWKEYIGLMDKIKLKEVDQFGALFFQQYYLYLTAYGNLKKEEVIAFADGVYKIQNAKALGLKSAQEKFVRYRTLKPNSHYSMRIKGKNNNNAMMQSFQLQPWSVENHAQILILTQLMSQPYFAELRTNQQLGYVARSFPATRNGSIGLMAIIQSQNHPPQVLAERSKKFIDDFIKKTFDSITDEDLKPIKSSLVNELRTKSNTMYERFMQFETYAGQYRGRFNLNEDLAKVVESTSAASFKKFMSDSFLKTPPSAMTFYYFGEKAPGDPKKLPGVVFESVNDIKDWVLLNPYL